MTGVRAMACCAALVTSLAAAAASHASFPGANDRIAFNSDRDGNTEIYTMAPDGSAASRLTNNSASDTLPSWAAHGRRITFASDRDGNSEIYTMNANGSGQTRVTTNSASDSEPAWSPDGLKIVFRTNRDGNAEIYTMNENGTSPTRLTSNTAVDADPAWSPDGTKIAFRSNRDGNNEIYVMNADGSAQANVTNNAAFDADPSWSPDGMELVFHTDRDGNFEVYSMNADGSAPVRLTNDPATDASAVWSADGTKVAFTSTRDGNSELYTMTAAGDLPTNRTGNAAFDAGANWRPGYQIPAAAPAVRVSLVPNYRATISTTQCMARGAFPSTHAPPDFPGGSNPDGSCRPPSYLPGQIAMLGIKAVAYVEFTVVPGNPATAADEQDYAITVDVSDVRSRNLPTGSDYNPNPSGADASVIAKLRISDTMNGPTQAEPGTLIDYDFVVPVNCNITIDSTIGSACTASTTADALIPGVIPEGRNSVIEVFRIRLRDSGVNAVRGDTDDRDFAQQGIYGP